MAFWNKWPYSNFHEINLDWVIREMKKISGVMGDFARQWEKSLQTEKGERQEADRQLQENIDKEQQRAEAAEEELDQKIDAETERATAAENNLQQQITANDGDIANLQEALATETEERKAADAAEQSARERADSALDSKITAETERATGVESELRKLINTETSNRVSEITRVEGLITTETGRATAAEEALGDRIDGIEGELDGITGEESPFIRKDGTTTTTGKIPLALGGTSEVDPAAATDLVNLRSMQAADEALQNAMTEYTDNQIEAAAADLHGVPAGGTAGQVLGKVDGTDYNVQWVDQSGGGGDDPNAIRKDGTTVTTASIPFAHGITVDGIAAAQTLQSSHLQSAGSALDLDGMGNGITADDIGGVTLSSGTASVSVKGGTGVQIKDGTNTPTAGQVLTAVDADGTAEWQDAPGGSDPDAIRKDGTTITTAEIPMLYGMSVGNAKQARVFNAPGGEYGIISGPNGGPVRINVRDTNIGIAGYSDSGAGPQNAGVSVASTGFVEIMSDGQRGETGQVLTANGDGTCGWADGSGGFTLVSETENARWYKDSNNIKMVVFTKAIRVTLTGGAGRLNIEGAPEGCEPIDSSIVLPFGLSVSGTTFVLKDITIRAGFSTIAMYSSDQAEYSTLLRGTVLFYE